MELPNSCSGKQILLVIHPMSVTGWPCSLWS